MVWEGGEEREREREWNGRGEEMGKGGELK